VLELSSGCFAGDDQNRVARPPVATLADDFLAAAFTVKASIFCHAGDFDPQAGAVSSMLRNPAIGRGAVPSSTSAERWRGARIPCWERPNGRSCFRAFASRLRSVGTSKRIRLTGLAAAGKACKPETAAVAFKWRLRLRDGDGVHRGHGPAEDAGLSPASIFVPSPSYRQRVQKGDRWSSRRAAGLAAKQLRWPGGRCRGVADRGVS